VTVDGADVVLVEIGVEVVTGEVEEVGGEEVLDVEGQRLRTWPTCL